MVILKQYNNSETSQRRIRLVPEVVVSWVFAPRS